MNYLAEILAFENWIEYNSMINKSDIRLWYTLMNIANRFGWSEFTIPISKLIFKSKLDKATIYRARNKLKQLKLIDFKERSGNQCSIYQMLSCVSLYTTQNDIQIETVDDTENESIDDTENETVNDTTSENINKTKNQKGETKNNIVTPKGVTPSKNEKVEQLFNTFWIAYPKKVAKTEAHKAFFKIKNMDEHLLNEILAGISKWKKSEQWRESNGQYIPYPSTFLNRERWRDELFTPITENKNHFQSDAETTKWLDNAKKLGI